MCKCENCENTNSGDMINVDRWSSYRRRRWWYMNL